MFIFSHRLSGQAPTIQDVTIADTVVLSRGELCNLESGELTTAVTADTALVGATVEAVDNTADGLKCKVITDPDAVYSIVDANARLMGATLDIDTGALGVAASSNADLIVVKTCTADEPTLVTFAGSHYLQL